MRIVAYDFLNFKATIPMEKAHLGPPVLVTGGTGHLGRDIVEQLLRRHGRVRVLARTPGDDPRVEWARGDLATGEGLREALAGIGAVVHAATSSPIARRGGIRPIDFFTTPRDVDIDGTRRLLDESRRAAVDQFLFVSIAGLAPDNPLPYNRVKLEAEALVRGSDVPWSIVRAAPFYYLLARLLHGIRWMPWWWLPDAPMQPVDTADVAARIVECVEQRKPGVLEEIGGPEARPFPHLAQDYLEARGLRRRVLRFRLSDAKARRMGFAATSGRTGSLTWREWLSAHGD